MEYNRELYKCECSCGKVFYAAKSIFQEWGELDCGCGSCPGCKTFYNLTVQEESKSMKLTPWDEYIQKRGIKNEDGSV